MITTDICLISQTLRPQRHRAEDQCHVPLTGRVHTSGIKIEIMNKEYENAEVYFVHFELAINCLVVIMRVLDRRRIDCLHQVPQMHTTSTATQLSIIFSCSLPHTPIQYCRLLTLFDENVLLSVDRDSF